MYEPCANDLTRCGEKASARDAILKARCDMCKIPIEFVCKLKYHKERVAQDNVVAHPS